MKPKSPLLLWCSKMIHWYMKNIGRAMEKIHFQIHFLLTAFLPESAFFVTFAAFLGHLFLQYFLQHYLILHLQNTFAL